MGSASVSGDYARNSRALGRAKDRKPDSASRRREFAVMRREGEFGYAATCEERAREVDRVERAQQRREGFRCAVEYCGIDGDELERSKTLEDRGTAVGHFSVRQTESYSRPVDRAETFQPNERARQRPPDLAPTPQRTGFRRHDAQ